MVVVQMKGQIFIMVAILVLVILFIMRSGTRPFVIKPKSLLFENFLNLKSELINTVDTSILKQQDISSNLDNFMNFATDIFEQKGYEADLNYSISTSGNEITVFMNLSLELEGSYLRDNLIVNRKVYT